MLDRSEVGKRGYLNEGFRLFHLKDSRAPKLDYHYHEFDKLILLLGGKVTYVVEGVTYFLRPWDVLLVQHNMIHPGWAGSGWRTGSTRKRPWTPASTPSGTGAFTCCAPTRSGVWST